MLVEISHGTVSFGAETILSDINFIIKNTEKIAIVGRNGCGKTTLLNLIAGRVDLDKRDNDQNVFIARRGGLTIGYLQQNAFDDDSVRAIRQKPRWHVPNAVSLNAWCAFYRLSVMI